MISIVVFRISHKQMAQFLLHFSFSNYAVVTAIIIIVIMTILPVASSRACARVWNLSIWNKYDVLLPPLPLLLLLLILLLLLLLGHAVAKLVEALFYKPEGRGFDSRWHNPSGRTVAMGLTQPLTEMSTRSMSWESRWPVRRTNNLTTFMCRLSWNLGASNSWNPQALSRPLMGLLYLYYYYYYY
jgi:hypothetical protein